MANKQQKSELVALYRLEFYKKQKNWKLSNEYKAKSKQKSKEIHSSTYEIDPESSDSPLNIGHLEEKRDENTPGSDTCDDVPEKITKESTTSHEIWQEEEQNLNTNDENYSCGVNLDDWFGDQAWNQQSALVPQTNQYNMNIQEYDHCMYNNYCYDTNDQIHTDEIDSPCLYRSQSIDSLSEFIRGAHIAPHSSELDLAEDACNFNIDVSWSVARMSSKQLSEGINRNIRSLSMLLRETAIRDRDKHQPPSLDVPTRDDNDIGTLGNISNLGRGRGRLQNANLIGIGMGRPFRLYQ